MRKSILLFVLVAAFFLLSTKSTLASDYYVSPQGNDSNSGSSASPWRTIDHAFDRLQPGDTLYVGAGTYTAPMGGWSPQNSGTSQNPITITNKPGEQAIFKVPGSDIDYSPFRCWDDPDWQTPKADYINFKGTKVSPRTLSNGVTSDFGLVIQGPAASKGEGNTSANGFWPTNCDYWEISGMDFVDIGYAIFTRKITNSRMGDYSTDHWYIHNNRVQGFYAESGMQFNGDLNRIENNQITKAYNFNVTQWGCQAVNLLGYGNVVKGNVLSKGGSTVQCFGVMLEWDQADDNLIEQNEMWDFDIGIIAIGGDDNIIRNNLIIQTKTPDPYAGGIFIDSTDSNVIDHDGPHSHCNTEWGELKPPNNSSHPEYYNYWQPRNCHSSGYQIYNNVIHGYVEGVRFWEVVSDNNIIRNNLISGWSRGAICNYNASSGTCGSIPSSLTHSNNSTPTSNSELNNLGVPGYANYDFHLSSSSSLINAGYNLGSLVPNDFEGKSRPQGQGFDIGAYEYGGSVVPTNPPTPTPTTPPIPSADANGDSLVDGIDYTIWLKHEGEQNVSQGPSRGDFNFDRFVNLLDYDFWLLNYW